ncbi:MAG: O-antigen ligase family protein [Bacilli bacterium]|nr:O-antigen ligase family protein [Bacilli bacterium]
MKKFKIEYLLYIFIIISPFLDALSFLWREWFVDSKFSISTILRPIIPIILLTYIFIKEKKLRIALIISALIFMTYGFIHLYLYKGVIRTVSYGSIFHEAQYVLNYTYMLYVLFIFLYFSKKKNLTFLNESLVIMLCGYLFLIYFSIITGTSSSTYIEGMGYKSYFTSANSLSTVLIMLLSCTLAFMLKKKKILSFIILLLLGIYLVFLIGTRTGLFGFVLVLVIYLITSFLIKLFKSRKINYKKILIPTILFFIFAFILFNFGSNTLARRKHLKEESNSIIDINTNKPGHTTGDTANFVYQIKNNTMEKNYMSEAQKLATISMYEYANSHKLDSTDSRLQQLIYHTYLVKYQKNILYILFGNGYLANNGEMTLEMEIPALLYNFGLLGFIIYLGPFIFIFVYSVKNTIKSIKKVTIDNLMCLFTLCLAFFLSAFAGYVFFSVSCILIIIVTCIFLLKDVKYEKISFWNN